MTSTVDNALTEDMGYEWLTANGKIVNYSGINFERSCELIHSGPCSVDLLRKGAAIGKVGMKYYISFHLIPLLLRLRKCKDMNQVGKLFGKTVIEYIRSVLFMIFLVGGMKVGQCVTNHSEYPYLGKDMLIQKIP